MLVYHYYTIILNTSLDDHMCNLFLSVCTFNAYILPPPPPFFVMTKSKKLYDMIVLLVSYFHSSLIFCDDKGGEILCHDCFIVNV